MKKSVNQMPLEWRIRNAVKAKRGTDSVSPRRQSASTEPVIADPAFDEFLRRGEITGSPPPTKRRGELEEHYSQRLEDHIKRKAIRSINDGHDPSSIMVDFNNLTELASHTEAANALKSIKDTSTLESSRVRRRES